MDVDANVVIASLTNRIAEDARKIAVLEAQVVALAGRGDASED